jgi:hypothetical protein
MAPIAMRPLTAVSDGGRRGRGDGDERLARVIGRTRARVLAAVGEPQTTEHVAQLIGACGVPKLRSHRGIIPICRRNRVLTPNTDNAEKLRG